MFQEAGVRTVRCDRPHHGEREPDNPGGHPWRGRTRVSSQLQ